MESFLAKGFEQLSIRPVGDGFFADSEDRLWRHDPGYGPAHGRTPETYAFALVNTPAGVEAQWFARPDKGRPRTLDALTRLRDRQAAMAEAQLREREQGLAQLRKSAEPVSLDAIEGGEKITLRAAAERVHGAGGQLRLEGGRLVVALPVGALGGGMGNPKAAVRRLYAAEETVVACLKEKRELPDALVTPNGLPIE